MSSDKSKVPAVVIAAALLKKKGEAKAKDGEKDQKAMHTARGKAVLDAIKRGDAAGLGRALSGE